jgi:hypothetical protein
VESSHDSEVLAPVDLLNEESGNERPHVWSDQEAESPEVNLSSSLVEEEHIMNDSEANHLWCSIEEALQGATRSEAGICWGESCTNNNNAREDLGPEEDW